MRLKDKVAIVTGCTAGIGRTILDRFVEEGASVVAIGRNEVVGRQLESESSGRVRFLAGDVTDPETGSRAVALIRDGFDGQLDILVNNAAIDLSDTPLEKTSREQIEALFSTNVFGVIEMMQACRPVMKRGAAVVNVTSRLAHVGYAGSVVYSATKGAVESLSRGAAVEWAGDGIRVNCVAPGLTETPMVTRWLEDQEDPKGFRAGIEQTIPLNRIAQPAEVAGAVLYLASDEATAITGSSLLVDGGYVAA